MLDFEKITACFNIRVYVFLLFAAVNICFGQSTWKVVASLPQNNRLYSVTYGDNQFMAVGCTILTSPDAITWTIKDSSLTCSFFSVAYGDSLFVVVEGGAILSSPNGTSWINKTLSYYFAAITFSNGRFATAGGVSDGYGTFFGRILTSSDGGTTWIKKDLPAIKWFNSIIFNDSLLMAVGSGGGIITSSDTSTWTKRNSMTTKDLNSVVYGNSQFVAVGAGGTILTSPDDSIWTKRNSGITSTLNSIIYGNNQYVTVGDSGRILTSPDAMSWTIRNSGTIKALRGIVYADSQFVAVGDSGVILTSKADGTGIAFHAKSHIPDNGRIKIKSSNSGISIILPIATAPGLLKIELFTVTGKRVYSATSRGTNGVLKIPALGFPTGMYYLSIEDNLVSAKSAAFILAR